MNQLYKSKTTKNIIFIFVLLSIWYFISISGWANPQENGDQLMWFARIDEVLSAISEIIINKNEHVISTLILIFKSSLLVVILGIIIGLVLGYFKSIYESISWSLDFWRAIPPIVIIFLLINIDKTVDGLYWRIWLVIFGCLPIMISQIAEAVLNASKKKLSIFSSVNPGFIFKVKNVIQYEILPSLFSTTRTVVAFAIIIVIVSEIIDGPNTGIGKKINEFQTASEIPYVYAYAIIIGVIGMFINGLLRLAESKLIRWT